MRWLKDLLSGGKKPTFAYPTERITGEIAEKGGAELFRTPGELIPSFIEFQIGEGFEDLVEEFRAAGPLYASMMKKKGEYVGGTIFYDHKQFDELVIEFFKQLLSKNGIADYFTDVVSGTNSHDPAQVTPNRINFAIKREDLQKVEQLLEDLVAKSKSAEISR